MLDDVFKLYSNQIASMQIMLTCITILIHLIFASAVAKDAGEMTKLGQRTALVSGIVWAFATLIGGVFTAIAYWFVHHSTLTRTGYWHQEEK